jgi:alpha-L-arabinofuranosidase
LSTPTSSDYVFPKNAKKKQVSLRKQEEMSSKITLERERTIGAIDPKLFGGFLEHMGRAIYEGIYEPESPFADEDGLRLDVLAALGELKPSIIRYPGGQFPERVSLDGRRWTARTAAATA